MRARGTTCGRVERSTCARPRLSSPPELYTTAARSGSCRPQRTSDPKRFAAPAAVDLARREATRQPPAAVGRVPWRSQSLRAMRAHERAPRSCENSNPSVRIASDATGQRARCLASYSRPCVRWSLLFRATRRTSTRLWSGTFIALFSTLGVLRLRDVASTSRRRRTGAVAGARSSPHTRQSATCGGL
jgi:hypothetical protein